jgi:hypothetical protein
MQAVTVKNDENPVSHIRVHSKIHQGIKRWGIRLNCGPLKNDLFIFIGLSDEHLVNISNGPSGAKYSIDQIGIYIKPNGHHLIIDESRDTFQRGTVLVRLIVDAKSGRDKNFVPDSDVRVISLHTYTMGGPGKTFSRSEMLAFIKPGQHINIIRTGQGIQCPFGTVRNNEGIIESSWTRTPR